MSEPSGSGLNGSPTLVGEPVEVRNIVKSFPSQSAGDATPVLRGVTIPMPAGRITSVLGESGCGKTTLLRIVAGLEEPTAGQVVIGGRDVTAVAPSRRGVAMVFQNYGLYPSKSVRKNIEFPLKMAGVAPAERRARAAAVAEIMHIEHVLDRLPAALSGGQRQRVGICRAVVRDPGTLLMDEPLSNLDAKLRIEMRTELVALQRRIGSTLMYVTHDQGEAMSMSDELVLMRAGVVEQSGTPLEVFNRPATSYAAAFLGAMNLLPGGASDGVWTSVPGAPMMLGVRPEHLDVVRAEDTPDSGLRLGVGVSAVGSSGGAVLQGDVVHTELLGTDRLVHVRVDDTIVKARVDSGRMLSERVVLTARPEHVHVFDGATGVRVDV
ncbi:ABC transporter ATP-binding protein [Plantibacter sp. Mn2098]|uniref:ABC transporter ATP-binding protein n=1 Tax=Plantibacter sp. Mn2098 TaxID=3395266 RepID=UPI003BD68217